MKTSAHQNSIRHKSLELMFTEHFRTFHLSIGAIICVKTRKGINKFHCNISKVIHSV